MNHKKIIVRTPSVDDLYTAAQWLEVDERAEDAESCKRVADWLRKKADAKDLRSLKKKSVGREV